MYRLRPPPSNPTTHYFPPSILHPTSCLPPPSTSSTSSHPPSQKVLKRNGIPTPTHFFVNRDGYSLDPRVNKVRGVYILFSIQCSEIRDTDAGTSSLCSLL